jgi:hypothetical protein
MKLELALAAVSMKTALKYSRKWNRNAPIVKVLQNMMPAGPGKKGFRLYFDIGTNHKNHYTIPPAVRSALQKAGFVATDYLAKKCVKIGDKEQKNVFNIGKVIGKDAHAKMAFDNDPQLQNTKQGAMQVVISCHPYDIIGMSTGRDWDKMSCMRLADGEHKFNPGSNQHYVRNDVSEGTLVAYVVSADDQNIQRPKARCLLKPFYNEEGQVLYRRETRVYGNPVPGFDLILSRFLRKINANIPEGTFKMPHSLYDDGMGKDHYHNASSDDNLTVEDVVNDTAHAVQFIHQQLKAMPDKETRDQHAENIIEFLNNETVETRLKETQVDEIVEALKGSKALVNGIHLLAYKNKPLTSVLAEVGRRIGSFDKTKGFTPEVLKALDDDKVHDLSYGGGNPVMEALSRVENLSDHELRENTRIFKMILTGKTPPPTKEELETLPNCARILNTAAHAARHMTMFGDDSMQKGAYAILDLGIDVENPIWWGPDAADMMYATGGVNLFLSYVMDNPGKLSSDALWACDPAITAVALANRRVFRFIDKMEDRQVAYLMDHVKLEQIKTVISNPYSAQAYKDNRVALVKYLDENTEVINTLLNNWEPKHVKALAEYHLPAVMHLTDNGIIFGSQMADTIQALIPPTMAWEGPKLSPETVDIENAIQYMVQAGNLLDKPLHLERKFDEDYFELRDLTDVADHFRDTWANKRHSRTDSFPSLLYKMDFAGQRPDISHSDELMEHLGADAFGWVPTEKLPGEVRGFLKMIRGMELEPAIDALYNLINATRLLPLEDINSGVERKMDELEIIYPDQDAMDDDDYEEAMSVYDEQRQAFEDAIVESNYKTIRLNQKLVDALEKVKDFVGYDEDTDYWDEDTPAEPFEAEMESVEESDYEDNASRVRDLRGELKSEWESRPNELQEMKDDSGFSE